MVTIKFLYKYRHWIASVLTVTVSLMLMVTSVSADRVDVRDPDFSHHCKEPVADYIPMITTDGNSGDGVGKFVRSEYDAGQYMYYWTVNSAISTVYLYGDFHCNVGIEQTYSLIGNIYLPRFVNRLSIDIFYDTTDGKSYMKNFYNAYPSDDSYLRTHKAYEDSFSMWYSNSWYNSVNDNNYIEYYIVNVNHEIKLPKGAYNISFGLNFHSSENTNLMYVFDDLQVHHQSNPPKSGGSTTNNKDDVFTKLMGGYSKIIRELYGVGSVSEEWLEIYDRLNLGKAFDLLDGITTFFTFISTVAIDLILIPLNPMLEDLVLLITESLKPVLDSVLSNTGTFMLAFTPVLTDAMNGLTPQIERINDYLTDSFTNFFNTYLGPSLNSLIANTSGSTSSIFGNLNENIEKIINALFKPSDDSNVVVDFENMKYRLADKLPFIAQIESFFSALLNEDNYSEPAEPVGSYNVEVSKFTAVEIYNMYPHVFYVDNSYLGLANVSLKYQRYTLPYEFEPGKEYCIKASTVQTSAMNAFSIINLDGKYKDCNNQEGYTGHLKELLILARDDVNVINIVVYEVTEPDVGWSFNVLGTSVNIFDFSWYLPYKAFGDSVILSFAYLSFGWRLYKRLFTLI